MEQAKSLVKKLAEVMMAVKYIQKRGRNSHFGYNYATEADVSDAIREELAKRHVIMLPSVKGHSVREHTTNKGNVEFITAMDIEFTFYDGDSGETLSFNMAGEGVDTADKGIYKGITGTQKYALMKSFMIPTGDDPELDEDEDKPATTQAAPRQAPPQTQGNVERRPSEPQLKRLFAIARSHSIDDAMLKKAMLDMFNKASTKDLTLDEYNRLVAWAEMSK
jgi:hypothetical protein